MQEHKEVTDARQRVYELCQLNLGFVPMGDKGIDAVYDTARALVSAIELYRGRKVIWTNQERG